MTAAATMPSIVIAKFVDKMTPRVSFDASNPKHRLAYVNFAKNNKWSGGCPFKLEWPFVSVPALCQARLLDHYLSLDKELHK